MHLTVFVTASKGIAANSPAPDRLDIVPSIQLNKILALQLSVRVPHAPATLTCAFTIAPKTVRYLQRLEKLVLSL